MFCSRIVYYLLFKLFPCAEFFREFYGIFKRVLCFYADQLFTQGSNSLEKSAILTEGQFLSFRV